MFLLLLAEDANPLLQQQPTVSRAVIYYTQWSSTYRCLSKKAGWAFYSSVSRWDRKTFRADLPGIYGFLSWNDVMRTMVVMKCTQDVILVGDSPVCDGAVYSSLFETSAYTHSAPASADPIEYHGEKLTSNSFGLCNFLL